MIGLEHYLTVAAQFVACVFRLFPAAPLRLPLRAPAATCAAAARTQAIQKTGQRL